MIACFVGSWIADVAAARVGIRRVVARVIDTVGALESAMNFAKRLAGRRTALMTRQPADALDDPESRRCAGRTGTTQLSGQILARATKGFHAVGLAWARPSVSTKTRPLAESASAPEKAACRSSQVLIPLHMRKSCSPSGRSTRCCSGKRACLANASTAAHSGASRWEKFALPCKPQPKITPPRATSPVTESTHSCREPGTRDESRKATAGGTRQRRLKRPCGDGPLAHLYLEWPPSGARRGLLGLRGR